MRYILLPFLALILSNYSSLSQETSIPQQLKELNNIYHFNKYKKELEKDQIIKKIKESDDDTYVNNWPEVKRMNSEEVYKYFINKYGDNEFINEAKDSILSLTETILVNIYTDSITSNFSFFVTKESFENNIKLLLDIYEIYISNKGVVLNNNNSIYSKKDILIEINNYVQGVIKYKIPRKIQIERSKLATITLSPFLPIKEIEESKKIKFEKYFLGNDNILLSDSMNISLFQNNLSNGLQIELQQDYDQKINRSDTTSHNIWQWKITGLKEGVHHIIISPKSKTATDIPLRVYEEEITVIDLRTFFDNQPYIKPILIGCGMSFLVGILFYIAYKKEKNDDLRKVNEIKILISEGGIIEALDQLIELSRNSKALNNDLIQLKAQHKTTSKRFYMGEINNEDFSVGINRINKMTLEILDRISNQR